jgi:hypothetical protein
LIEASPEDVAIELGIMLSQLQTYSSRLNEVDGWNDEGSTGEAKALSLRHRIIEM